MTKLTFTGSTQTGSNKHKVQVEISRSSIDGTLTVQIEPKDAIIPDDKAEELLTEFFKMEDEEAKGGHRLSGWITHIEIDE